MDKVLLKYRCTRNKLYEHNCIGHDDISARQGHYVKATCALHAYGKMCRDFPKDIESGFTVERCTEEGGLVRVWFEALGDD